MFLKLILRILWLDKIAYYIMGYIGTALSDYAVLKL